MSAAVVAVATVCKQMPLGHRGGGTAVISPPPGETCAYLWYVLAEQRIPRLAGIRAAWLAPRGLGFVSAADLRLEARGSRLHTIQYPRLYPSLQLQLQFLVSETSNAGPYQAILLYHAFHTCFHAFLHARLHDSLLVADCAAVPPGRYATDAVRLLPLMP
jgi:hypothetical protein